MSQRQREIPVQFNAWSEMRQDVIMYLFKDDQSCPVTSLFVSILKNAFSMTFDSFTLELISMLSE